MNSEKKLELIARLINKLDRTEVFDVLQILLTKVQEDEIATRKAAHKNEWHVIKATWLADGVLDVAMTFN